MPRSAVGSYAIVIWAVRRGCWLLACAWALVAGTVSTCAQDKVDGRAPTIQAGSAILVEQETGSILYEQAAHVSRPIASTTKIMTALVILEHGGLAEQVVVSQRAADTPQASLLEPGESVALGDLLAAVLLRSANDAAVAAAAHVAGSVENFVARMNARARQLGANETHFANPHGLHQPDHYSSAHDLALLAREAMRQPAFRYLVGMKTTTMPAARKGESRLLINRNRLLFRCDWVDGIKTGYVRESGQCLVASGRQGGWRLLAVVLDSPDACAEARALLEWGFANFRLVRYARRGQLAAVAPVTGGRKPTVALIADADLPAVVPTAGPDPNQLVLEPRRIRAPVREGQRVAAMWLRAGAPALPRLGGNRHAQAYPEQGRRVGAGGEPTVIGLRAAHSVGLSWIMLAWLWGKRLAVAAVVSLVGLRLYGAAAKGARRRRRRFPAGL